MQLQRDVDMKMLNTRKAPVWWSGWLLALTFVAFAGGQVHAWEVRDTLAAEEESLLKNPAFDVLVVAVLAVEDTGATNGNPPRVELGVEEFLRGGDRAATVTATWQAPVFHEDVKDSGGFTEAWKARSLAGPEVGAKLIVFSIGPAEAAGVQAASVYRFSPENRAVVLEHAATERSGSIQILLFFVILAMPFLMVILFVRSSSTEMSQKARRGLRLAVSALAVLTLGLYVFYETGISAYSNIRVDLIVIWPAVGAALVVGVVSLFKRRSRAKVSAPPGAASSGLLAVLGRSLVWGLGAGLVAAVAGFLAPMIPGGSESEQGLLTAVMVGPPGFFVGSFLALLWQVRRVRTLPLGSKTAYGLILLLLFFPFLSSVVSVSSLVIAMSTVEVSGTEQNN